MDKKTRKSIRRIIVLKGEHSGAKFSRKQAEDTVERLEKERKLAIRRANRQAKYDKNK